MCGCAINEGISKPWRRIKFYLFDLASGFTLSLDAQVQVILLLQLHQWWTKLKLPLTQRRNVRTLESQKDLGNGQEVISSLYELVAIVSLGNHSTR